MKRRFGILISLGGLGLVVALGFLAIQPREPLISGRTLDEWAAAYLRSSEGPNQSTNTPQCQEAMAAVRASREETLRWGLKYANYEKAHWKSRIQSILENLNVRKWGHPAIWEPFYQDPGERVVVCFQMLGPEGRPALPQLLRIISETKSPYVAERAIDAMSYIGDAAIPAFGAIIADRRHHHRRPAIVALRTATHGCPRMAESLIPLVIECARDSDPQLAAAALGFIGDLGLDPEVSVPALISCLGNRNPYLRRCALESLQRFGAQARPAAEALARATGDPDFQVRWAATNALLLVAPEKLNTLTALPGD